MHKVAVKPHWATDIKNWELYIWFHTQMAVCIHVHIQYYSSYTLCGLLHGGKSREEKNVKSLGRIIFQRHISCMDCSYESQMQGGTMLGQAISDVFFDKCTAGHFPCVSNLSGFCWLGLRAAVLHAGAGCPTPHPHSVLSFAITIFLLLQGEVISIK